MSEPIRYAMTWGEDEDGTIYIGPKEQADGQWVKHSDYASLKADVEQLKDALFKHSVENHRLQVEVERLRTGGENYNQIITELP